MKGRLRGSLIALVLGVAAYLVTDEVVVGVLVATISWWFFRKSKGRRTGRPVKAKYPNPSESPRKRSPQDGEGIAVVCKQVTAERQEWVSVKTGRLFDVLSPDGPPNAQPGDPGEVFISGTRYTVKVPADRSAADKTPVKTRSS